MLTDQLNSPYGVEYQAAFYVIGGSVHPDDITRQLGLTPTLAFVQGSPLTTPAGTRPHPRHLWRFSAPPMPEESNPGKALEFLLQVFEPLQPKLAALRAGGAELYVELICLLDEDKRSTSYSFEPSLLVRLASLRVGMGHVFRRMENPSSSR